MNNDDRTFKFKFFNRPEKQKKDLLDCIDVDTEKYSEELSIQMERLLDPTLLLTGGIFSSFRSLILQIIALQVIGRLFFLVGVMISKVLIDGFEGESISFFLLGGILVSQSGFLLVNYRSKLIQGQVLTGVGVYLVAKINQKLISADPSNLRRGFSNANIKVLLTSDVKHIQSMVTGLLTHVVPMIVTILVFTPFIWSEMAWAGLTAILVSFALLPLAYILSIWIKKYQTKIQIMEGEVIESIEDWVRNIRAIRYLGLKKHFSSKIELAINAVIRVACKQHTFVILNFAISMIWWMAPITVLYLLSSHTEINYSIGSVFSALWMVNLLNSSIRYLPFVIQGYGSGKVCFERYLKLLSIPDRGCILKPSESNVEDVFSPMYLIFENVDLIASGKIVCSSLNFKINLHKNNLIIGHTACGKSVLMDAIAAVTKPHSGTVYIEDTDGRRYDLWSENIHSLYRDWSAYQQQDIFISNDTIAHNIALSNSWNEEKLSRILGDVSFYRDLESFPDGYFHMLGEGGNTLSGGQQQRIGLARVLYFEKNCNILDDPLSALDKMTATKILNNLLSRREGLIISTNRYIAIDSYDHIYVMNDGRIVESGDVTSLANKQESELNKLMNFEKGIQ